MAQTFNNIPYEKEVAIAIEQILIAPFPTSWTPAKLTDPVDTPPVGFRNLGAVVEDSVTLTITREKFQLRTGIPKVLNYEAIMGVSATLEASLIARRGRLAGFAMGNVKPINMLAGTAVTTLSSVTNRAIVTLVASPNVAWAVGDLIGFSTTTPGLVDTEQDAYISSINALTVVFSPAFPDTPAVNNLVQKISGIRNPFGTSGIRKFHVLGVADFIDNIQVVHQFPKCDSSGDWTEQFRPDQEGRLPMKLEALGYQSSTFDSSTSHLLVGERYWFNS